MLQGVTLAPLIRALGMASEADVRQLRRTVTEAALEQLRTAENVPDGVREGGDGCGARPEQRGVARLAGEW